jgi:predicted RNase H-like nuclease (RuvC/YqgF family)
MYLIFADSKAALMVKEQISIVKESLQDDKESEKLIKSYETQIMALETEIASLKEEKGEYIRQIESFTAEIKLLQESKGLEPLSRVKTLRKNRNDPEEVILYTQLILDKNHG